MGSELVNIRVHYGNGIITFCDSGVDLSEFQYVDTSICNPLQMRHADMLRWMHNFMQVNPSYWRLKVSGVVPRKREHGWRWELYEMRNSKCWRAFVDMALYKFKFPLVVLVQQEMANISQGGTGKSHGVHEMEEVGETNCTPEQDMEEETQQMVHEQPQLEVDDNEDEVVPRWATGTTRLTYPAFVAAFDQLTDDRVRWNPYTAALTAAHASRGLSILCYRDQLFCFTKKHLMFDIFVEPYYVHQVGRELGVRQEFPLPHEPVDQMSHLMTRKGQRVAYEATWATKMETWAEQWAQAATGLHLAQGPDVSEELVSCAERLEANPPRVGRLELASGLRRLAQRCMSGLRRATCRGTRDVVAPQHRVTSTRTTHSPGPSTAAGPSRVQTDSLWPESPTCTPGVRWGQVHEASGSEPSFTRGDDASMWPLEDIIPWSQMPGAPQATQPT
ncbi:hypothetical protein C2845_PM11G30530 [Panicum miliaceum]|uniref:Aminotransferase-like plant mobile domain-containing protein n=1 Tax=Panicum miliaceum TaxID=4540 RepID=A0A3L6RVJ5_PANMI|nr:hypothetical protein C2845_PM11G30530 [Panicum miliaceum]